MNRKWAAIAAATIFIVPGVTAGPLDEYADMGERQAAEARAYCDAVAGPGNYTLINSRAVGHGGLHCELDNGTLVHPFEWQRREAAQPWYLQAPFDWMWMILGLLVVGVLGSAAWRAARRSDTDDGGDGAG